MLQVTVNATTYTLGTNPQLTSDGSGHWSLAISTALPDGTYSVSVHTADAAGNVANVTATNVLLVDTVVPATPTVNALTTTNPTPTLTGTWDAAQANLLQVTISNSAAAFSAVYTLGNSPQLTANGSSWTLNLAGTTPLAVGTYGVAVHTANVVGVTAESSGGILTISAAAPVVGALTPQSANVAVPVNILAAITGGDMTGLLATIQWGDGTTTSGSIATVGGVLTASASHAYAAAGNFNIQLTVTNAAGLSTTVATTATITSVSSGANLQVKAGSNLQIAATNSTAAYDFDVRFVYGGVKLVGVNGTTFNGAQSLFIAGVKSVSAQLGNGDDHVRISGQGTAVSLALGGGQNDVVFEGYSGGKVQVSADGALSVRALNSTMSSLMVNGGGADDLFRASNLNVTGETQLALGSGANTVSIDNSHFNNFKLQSSGGGTIVRIEAGQADGNGTQFDGVALFQVGGGAKLSFSPQTNSDRTSFRGSLTIIASAPDATWLRQNVTLAHTPNLHNVDVVSGYVVAQHGNNGHGDGHGGDH